MAIMNKKLDLDLQNDQINIKSDQNKENQVNRQQGDNHHDENIQKSNVNIINRTGEITNQKEIRRVNSECRDIKSVNNYNYAPKSNNSMDLDRIIKKYM